MDFNPQDHVVRLCLQGMSLEAGNKADEAGKLFLRAWNDSTENWQRFLSAYFVAQHQAETADRLKWLETALQIALRINDDSVRSAFHRLYSAIGKCHEELGDSDEASKCFNLAKSSSDAPADQGPFFHGTKADLQIGGLLTAGRTSNYKDDLTMNHVYFTALPIGAGLAAGLAKGEGAGRVYVVEPTGPFEHDPNVTNQKFPGNPTRSYRSLAPLRIVSEQREWDRQTPEELAKWRERLAASKGEIIN